MLNPTTMYHPYPLYPTGGNPAVERSVLACARIVPMCGYPLPVENLPIFGPFYLMWISFGSACPVNTRVFNFIDIFFCISLAYVVWMRLNLLYRTTISSLTC